MQCRSFRRSPGFASTVIGTIALGLGLNVALFTIFNAYVLRPLSIRDPYGLYSFTWTNREGRRHSFSWREFESFRKNNPVFSEAAASSFLYARVNGHPLMGELVTGNYFHVLRHRCRVWEDSNSRGFCPLPVRIPSLSSVTRRGRASLAATRRSSANNHATRVSA